MVILGVGSLLAIVLGFILAALIDREVAGKAIFRTLFLYPLAVSLIVTGIAWRWLFNPTMGIQNFLHTHGLTFINFNWLAAPETVMYGIILGVVWQSTGFYMALMLAGLKSINIEIWQAAKVDGVPFWRLYFEVIIPMMKLTFLTAILLLSIGVVKAYDIVVAMTNGGPGGNSYVPAYFMIQAYWVKRNLGFASSAATIMLLMTFLLFLPFVLFRRRAVVVTQAAIEVPGLRAIAAGEAKADQAASRGDLRVPSDGGAVLLHPALRDRHHLAQNDGRDPPRPDLCAAGGLVAGRLALRVVRGVLRNRLPRVSAPASGPRSGS